MDDDLEDQYQQLRREIMALEATSPRQRLAHQLLRALITFDLDAVNRLLAQLVSVQALKDAGVPVGADAFEPRTLEGEREDP